MQSIYLLSKTASSQHCNVQGRVLPPINYLWTKHGVSFADKCRYPFLASLTPSYYNYIDGRGSDALETNTTQSKRTAARSLGISEYIDSHRSISIWLSAFHYPDTRALLPVSVHIVLAIDIRCSCGSKVLHFHLIPRDPCSTTGL